MIPMVFVFLCLDFPCVKVRPCAVNGIISLFFMIDDYSIVYLTSFLSVPLAMDI